ncbi:hypothetical protein RN001_003738 [Aquatica leii]|uniref:MADF domain-containing protein n=1 Tax=Aquatica leii TaxID=1421715 RepID=A0AAN7Q9U6_9COLE|nr:hypothetical protein RN001_003738 [Aquatica leii]
MASGWSREEVSMLIDLYRERDILYNVKMPMYHNKHARTDAFEEIVRNVQEVLTNTTVDPDVSSLQLPSASTVHSENALPGVITPISRKVVTEKKARVNKVLDAAQQQVNSAFAL